MFRNRKIQIAPKGSASDTIIAYCLGIVSAVFIMLSIIKSIVSKGSVERIYGVLMMSALVMSVTGTLFAIMGYNDDEGSVTGKKLAIIINAATLIISLIFLLKGL